MAKNKGDFTTSSDEVPDARILDRRKFLVQLLSVSASVLHGKLPSTLNAETFTLQSLHVPPTASANDLKLKAARAVVHLGGGKYSKVLAYNGLFPGPTIVASKGDSANFNLANRLSQDTTIHWHGMIVPPGADGQPRDAIAPGEDYTYQYEIVQRASLNWYHAHPHMRTAEQVVRGLAGAFIIRDPEETALKLPSGKYEIPLIVRDATFDTEGNILYPQEPRRAVPLVNGTRNARLKVDTAFYRFRVLNASNGRLFRLALSNGRPLTLIGNDGGLLESPVILREIEIGPAERLDLIVSFKGLPVETKVMLQERNEQWNLLTFYVSKKVSVSGSVPGNLSTIPRLTDFATTREFSFDGEDRINGKVYDLNRIDFKVPFRQTERWRFTVHSTGPNSAPHLVHVHGASFQVQSRTGGRGVVFPWERGWKDTVLLKDHETVDVLIRFDHFRGVYLLHCHRLEHEDFGMMSNFKVF